MWTLPYTRLIALYIKISGLRILLKTASSISNQETNKPIMIL